MSSKIRFLLVLTAITLAILLSGPRKTMPSGPPPDSELDFSLTTARGFIDTNGKYVFYSRGQQVTKDTFPQIGDSGAKVYEVEFPLKTKDGFTVYGMYYAMGTIDDASMLWNTFGSDSEQRWILTVHLPSILRSAIKAETGKQTFAFFVDRNNPSPKLVEENVLKTMIPVWEEFHFSPTIVSILVYAPPTQGP